MYLYQVATSVLIAAALNEITISKQSLKEGPPRKLIVVSQGSKGEGDSCIPNGSFSLILNGKGTRHETRSTHGHPKLLT